MFTRLRIPKDRITAAAIILLVFLILGLLYAVRSHILSFTISMYKSHNRSNEVFILWVSWVIALLSFLLFPILGYRKALQKGLNPILWAIICTVTSLWGYLWLLFTSTGDRQRSRFISKTEKNGRNKRSSQS